MKKTLLLFFIVISNISISQVDTIPQTVEYITIRAKFDYQTGQITEYLSFNFNPQFEQGEQAYKLKDYRKDNKGEKFTYLTELLNYMNKFGFELEQMNTIDYRGKANDDKGSLLNTNQYLMIIVMSKEIKTENN